MGSLSKAVERRLRRVLLALLRSRRGRQSREATPLSLSDHSRILLIRTDRIGDALISTPALRLLRARYPEARIDLLLGAKNRAVAPLMPFVDSVYVLPAEIVGAARTMTTLRSARYDVAVSLVIGDSASAAMIAGLSGARVSVGGESSRKGAKTQRGSAFDVVAELSEGEHIVEKTALLLRPLEVEIAIPMDETVNRLEVKLEEDRATTGRPTSREHATGVVLNVSAGAPERGLRDETWVELARRLANDGHRVLFTGAPADADRIRSLAESSGCGLLPPAADYADFARALRKAAMLLISPDTSTAHLAAALGIPSIVWHDSERHSAMWRQWGILRRSIVGNAGDPEIVRRIAEAARELSTALRSNVG